MKKLLSKSQLVHTALILAILLLGFTVRMYGINWDNSQHVHPDERFLTMVATSMHLPTSFAEYLDPQRSPLNPYNYKGFSFFVYGMLPVSLTKLIAVDNGMNSYDGIVHVGRFLSACADVGILIMVYLIAGIIQIKYRLGSSFRYWSALIYALLVFPIQQAHFFTTDSFSVFFTMGAVYGAIKCWERGLGSSYWYTCLSGMFMGFALASKISSLYILPLIAGIYLCMLGVHRETRWHNLAKLYIHGLVFVACAYIALRLGDPRFFATGGLFAWRVNPRFLMNLHELNTLTNPQTTFPPSIQWFHTLPVLFALKNMVLWGLGTMVTVLSAIGIYQLARTSMKERYGLLMVILCWMGLFFLYQSSQFVKTMRYFYVLYPFLALCAGVGVHNLLQSVPVKFRSISIGVVVLGFALWPISYMRIYTQQHTYVSASEWIYEHVPPQSLIILEHWNDVAPLNLPPKENRARLSSMYTYVEAKVYDTDTPHKIIQLDKILSKGDYMVLINKRTYGSIMQSTDRYPLTSAWYRDLLAGRKGYEIVKVFESYPGITLGKWNLDIVDTSAESVFTEYDHPRVILLKKKAQL